MNKICELIHFLIEIFIIIIIKEYYEKLNFKINKLNFKKEKLLHEVGLLQKKLMKVLLFFYLFLSI